MQILLMHKINAQVSLVFQSHRSKSEELRQRLFLRPLRTGQDQYPPPPR
jgi:hypothetical protein